MVEQVVGFIAKEFKYTGLIAMGPIGQAVTLVMILTNALMFATACLATPALLLGHNEALQEHWLGAIAAGEAIDGERAPHLLGEALQSPR